MIIFKLLPKYEESLEGGLQHHYKKCREDRLYKDPGDVIQFPMTGSLSETNLVNWTDDTISEIQNNAGFFAMNRITTSTDPFGELGHLWMY